MSATLSECDPAAHGRIWRKVNSDRGCENVRRPWLGSANMFNWEKTIEYNSFAGARTFWIIEAASTLATKSLTVNELKTIWILSSAFCLCAYHSTWERFLLETGWRLPSNVHSMLNSLNTNRSRAIECCRCYNLRIENVQFSAAGK